MKKCIFFKPERLNCKSCVVQLHPRRFSLPCGQTVEKWRRENNHLDCCSQQEQEDQSLIRLEYIKCFHKCKEFRLNWYKWRILKLFIWNVKEFLKLTCFRRHSESLESSTLNGSNTNDNLKDSQLPPLTFLQSDDQDRRPSLAELQSEDMDRRPSITMYQSVDSQHPDVIAIQRLVERMKFGDLETVDSSATWI